MENAGKIDEFRSADVQPRSLAAKHTFVQWSSRLYEAAVKYENL